MRYLPDTEDNEAAAEYDVQTETNQEECAVFGSIDFKSSPVGVPSGFAAEEFMHDWRCLNAK